MHIPFLGRLSLMEWPVVAVSLFLSWLEYVSTFVTMLLPATAISMMTYSLQVVYSFTSKPIRFIVSGGDSLNDGMPNIKYRYLSGGDKEIDMEKYDTMNALLNAKDFLEMCAVFGYEVESRIVRTKDDYLLTVQRISRPNPGPRNGKVVYMHHGLLMCSEIWVTMLDKRANLPFVLYELGYDVWLGNNRGNKYSHKHLVHKVNLEKFWDFSLDDFAFYDIPNTIDYILQATKKSSLVYVGFSQGTAQAFASVSVNPDLNEKIERIVAISPATTPHGLYSKFLDILLKSSPVFVYLLFSRRVLMPSVLMWNRIMYPPFFDTSIDLANYTLFNWKAYNIDKMQKISSYAHLYSTTSVKTVVHWFQIISAKKFQMYHDEYSVLTPTEYPLKSIEVPIHLIYGDSDLLVDITVMENQLPKKFTTSHPVSGHEHLDNLWGRDVTEKVFPLVLEALGESVSNGRVKK